MKLASAIFGLLLLLFITPVFAQHQPCGFDILHNRLLKNDRHYRSRIAAQQESIRQYIERHKSSLSAKTNGTLAPLYTIPVVVHIVHTGGTIGSIYNPTDAQIISTINYLNQVYDGTYPGTQGVGDIQIQFVLAQRDPNCNPTNGINRINGSSVSGYVADGIDLSGGSGADELDIKNLIRWNTSNYYNIWVVNKIEGFDGTAGSGTAGFAYFPGASSSYDGTVMIATQMTAGAQTLPHEIGHALALYHPFQGSSGSTCPANTNCNTQGDEVCDTDPITQPSGFVCRSSATTNTCTGTGYNINTESNYMNYTNCHTLFTAGQKARMLAAMSLPSRSSLASSQGGIAPNAGTVCIPKINFEFTEDQKTEATATTSGCRSYSDYTYNMVIGVAPSATATATINIASGTATEGVDYDITTNGNFTSPSKTLTFPSGSTASQAFTIRVYNDAIVDGTETFTLGFTVNSGGGNAVSGNGRPNITITLVDNDSAPAGGSSTGTVSIGTATNIASPPFNATLQKLRSQFLYKASELTAAGIPAGTISGISLNLQKASTRAFSNLSIKMGTTSVNYLADASVTVVATTTVKTLASYNTVNGWNDFTFDAPFTWNGTSNVVVEICFDNGTTSGTDASDNILLYSDGGTASQANMIYQTNINCSENFTSINGFGNGRKPIAKFNYGIPGTAVQSTVNASKSEYLGPNADIYFYDQTDNKLLARIRNLSSHNYGCTQVVIDRAGNGATAFQQSNTSKYLMNKTFRVIPTTNNSSGQYEITLYYSNAEKTGWEAATGQNWTNIQLVKVPSQISNYSPSTPTPDGAGAVVQGTPTIGTLGSQHSLTYTFNNGFSGFGAGIAGTLLPVNIVEFNGKLNNGEVILSWSTTMEENIKVFEVEKSSDGIKFERIGSIKPAGNATNNYEYIDQNVNEVNYYRLNIVEWSGQSKLSDIVLIKKAFSKQNVRLTSNPFNQNVSIQLEAKAARVKMQLVNSAGSIVGEHEFINPSQQLTWVINGKISNGVYFLKMTVDGEMFYKKLIKE